MGRRKRRLKEEIHEFPGLAFPAFDGLEMYAGGWSPRVFGNLGPMHVEIGAGRGAFVRAMSKTLPEVNFVALELKPDRCTRIALGLQAEGSRNVRVLCGNASHLNAIFAPGEIERFWVNFPDPWPKARAVRKRVLQTERLRALRTLAAPSARLHFRTDSKALFEWVHEQLDGCGWRAIDEPQDDPVWDAAKATPTEYQLAFRLQARSTYYLHLEPQPDQPGNAPLTPPPV